MSGTCTGSITVEIPCLDTTWTCLEDRLEHSNCGNTRTTTSCNLAIDALEMIAGTRPVDLRYDVNNNGFIDTGDVTLLQGGTPLLAYREASLTSCSVSPSTIAPGDSFSITLNINSGIKTENYKGVLSGDISVDSITFTIYGTTLASSISKTLSFTMSSTSTGGSKYYTMSLVKVS